ncbi:MAG: tetratricopeptide repeat protein, partial [Phycisphaerae bacterium]|nr:tetratricopeptide repeat protein [Phycisphaerae bacterium]
GKAIELDEEAYEPTLIEAYVNVAEQYNQAGEFDKYIHYLGKAVAASPQTASLHLELANAYEENRQYADAISHWRMVLDLEPDHPMRMQLLNLIDKYRHQASSEGG